MPRKNRNGRGAPSAPREAAPGPRVAPWRGLGVGYLNDPEDPEHHLAVVLTVATEYGPLGGMIHPEFAIQLAGELVDHAERCRPVTGLEVVQELPPELRH